MAKVTFKYRTGDKYNPVYKTKTIDMELPKNEYGFILIGDLSKKIMEYIKTVLGVERFTLIWHQIKS